MLRALVNNILSEPLHETVSGLCPYCKTPVIPKCGSVKIHHWAHKNKSLHCIYEPMTEWHLEWQKYAESFGYETEKLFLSENGDRIADIYIPENKVIELQHSSIDTKTAVGRCESYKTFGMRLSWIFDYQEKYDKNHLTIVPIAYIENHYSLRQRWNKKVLHVLFEGGYPKYGRVFVQFNNEIFEVKKIHSNGNALLEKIDDRKEVFNFDVPKTIYDYIILNKNQGHEFGLPSSCDNTKLSDEDYDRYFKPIEIEPEEIIKPEVIPVPEILEFEIPEEILPKLNDIIHKYGINLDARDFIYRSKKQLPIDTLKKLLVLSIESLCLYIKEPIFNGFYKESYKLINQYYDNKIPKNIWCQPWYFYP